MEWTVSVEPILFIRVETPTQIESITTCQMPVVVQSCGDTGPKGDKGDAGDSLMYWTDTKW